VGFLAVTALAQRGIQKTDAQSGSGRCLVQRDDFLSFLKAHAVKGFQPRLELASLFVTV
jgi:hypothetical protein